MAPLANQWQTLAAEIRIEVMKDLFDLPTLRNLLMAYPSDKCLFNRYRREIFDTVLDNMPAELRRIVRSIYNGRYHAAVPPYAMLYAVGKECLPSKSPPEDPYANVDHVGILFSMAHMTESIYYFSACFARKRILLPSGHPQDELSPTEEHRILRAFWRFQQLYESNYPGEPGNGRGSKRYVCGRRWPNLGSDPGGKWLRGSAAQRFSSLYHYWGSDSPAEWEIDEIDAIRDHLRAEVNGVQIDRKHCWGKTAADPLQRQPVLIQELIKDIESWGTDPTKSHPDDHLLVADLEEGSAWRSSRRSPDLDTPAAAKAANICTHERQFLKERQGRLNIHEQWGWCMFDRERLIRCGLLPKGGVPHVSGTGNRQERIRNVELLESVKRSHQEYLVRLKKCLDPRIQAQFDADVALGKQLLVRSEEIKSRERLMEWVKPRNPALFQQWTALLKSSDFDKMEQMQAEVYHRQALVMQSLEFGRYRSLGRRSEEADLRLLVRMRECK